MMRIIDNPFNLSEESKSQRKQDNAFSIARSVGIKIDGTDEEAQNWIVDTYNRGSDLKEYDYVQDGISELADGEVPLYYWRIWTVFQQVAGWEHEEILEDMAFQYDGVEYDMNKMAQIVLYGLAEKILQQYVKDHDFED